MTKTLAFIMLFASTAIACAQSAEDTVAFLVKNVGEGARYNRTKFTWTKVGDHFEADWIRADNNKHTKDLFKIEAVDSCRYRGEYTFALGTKDEETQTFDYDFSGMSGFKNDGPYYLLEGAKGCLRTAAEPYCGSHPNALAISVTDQAETMRAMDYFQENFCKKNVDD